MDRDIVDAMTTVAHGLFVHPGGAMAVSEYWFSNYTAQLPAEGDMDNPMLCFDVNSFSISSLINTESGFNNSLIFAVAIIWVESR